MRSGREHWAWMVVVEVRQGTLGVDGRGWGPAGNTGQMVVVEVRQGTLGVDGRGWGPAENTVDRGSRRRRTTRTTRRTRRTRRRRRRTRQEAAGGGRRQEAAEGCRRRKEEATDIKSNNPHLAGGEKLLKIAIYSGFIHQKLWFSMVMLVYRRVLASFFPGYNWIKWSFKTYPAFNMKNLLEMDHFPNGAPHVFSASFCKHLPQGISIYFPNIKVDHFPRIPWVFHIAQGCIYTDTHTHIHRYTHTYVYIYTYTSIIYIYT